MTAAEIVAALRTQANPENVAGMARYGISTAGTPCASGPKISHSESPKLSVVFWQQTSPGWKGDALVFDGSAAMGGQKMGARDTFTKVSATEMKHRGEMQGTDGKWTATDEETCSKAAKK